jgi:hypothetical protein
VVGYNNNVAGGSLGIPVIVSGRFTLTSSKVIELRHYTGTTSGGTDELGRNLSLSGQPEIYASIEIKKVN